MNGDISDLRPANFQFAFRGGRSFTWVVFSLSTHEVMMIINKDQLRTLDRMAWERFEQEMVEHLKIFAPKLSAICGEETLLHVIRLGSAKAEFYGFTNRGAIRLYIELMVLFGCDFDRDPLLPWASKVLGDAVIVDQMSKAEYLHHRAVAYLDGVVGPDDRYLIEALSRLDQVHFDSFFVSEKDLKSFIFEWLIVIYPQKCEYASLAAIHETIQRGFKLARQYLLTDDWGVVLLSALPLFLGHGFSDDPLYSWIAHLLRFQRPSDPLTRTTLLYKKSKTYLREARAYLEEGQLHA